MTIFMYMDDILIATIKDYVLHRQLVHDVMAPRGRLFEVNSECLGYCSRPKPHVTYHVTQPLTKVVLMQVIAVKVVSLLGKCYLF
jgi:hypothetical protein